MQEFYGAKKLPLSCMLFFFLRLDWLTLAGVSCECVRGRGWLRPKYAFAVLSFECASDLYWRTMKKKRDQQLTRIQTHTHTRNRKTNWHDQCTTIRMEWACIHTFCTSKENHWTFRETENPLIVANDLCDSCPRIHWCPDEHGKRRHIKVSFGAEKKATCRMVEDARSHEMKQMENIERTNPE